MEKIGIISHKKLINLFEYKILIINTGNNKILVYLVKKAIDTTIDEKNIFFV